MVQGRGRSGKSRKVDFVPQNASIYTPLLDLGNVKFGPSGANVVLLANQRAENEPGLTAMYYSPYLLRIPN